MYVQFYFYYGLQSLVLSTTTEQSTTPQENQLCNARLNLHNLELTEKRNQSSIYTNLSIGTRPVSSAGRVCTFSTSSIARVCMWPICTTTCVFLLNNQGFLSMKNSDPLQPLVTSSSIFYCLILTITNHNTSMLSYILLMLLNHTI